MMTKKKKKKTTKQFEVKISDLLMLRRNPQYLTEAQMASLRKSISRDGFLVPVLVRQKGRQQWEIVSGNHRVLADQEEGYESVPAISVSGMTDKDVKRLAVNLNTIHGEPNVELFAPFLAECPDDVLLELHLEGDMISAVCNFDEQLKLRLDELQPPAAVNRTAPIQNTDTCKCPKCGRIHQKRN